MTIKVWPEEQKRRRGLNSDKTRDESEEALDDQARMVVLSGSRVVVIQDVLQRGLGVTGMEAPVGQVVERMDGPGEDREPDGRLVLVGLLVCGPLGGLADQDARVDSRGV